jgi:tetratricopeptide (TPR) repeat protein
MGEGDKDYASGLGWESTGGRIRKELNCGHSKREREAYLDQAWSQLRIAVNLDSANTLYREAFEGLSGALKRKPEYANAQSSASSDSLESLTALADSKLSVEHNKEVTADRDAVAAAKEAIRAEPTDGFAWSKLGDAYFQLGDYKNAYDATQEAIEIFKEKFKKVPSPYVCEAEKIVAQRQQPNGQAPLVCHDEAPTIVSMLANSYLRMADICEKLHKRHEARRYTDAALRSFGVLRMMHPSSQAPAVNPPVAQRPQSGTTSPAQSRPVPAQGAAVPCPSPVHEICQGPAYGSSDWRDYNRCRAGNRREDARYQQCLQQR